MPNQLTLFDAATPDEVLARIAAGLCLTCGADLTTDQDWFVWGDKGDLWCRACSAAMGVEEGKE